MDLWSARGQVPGSLVAVPERAKDIQYSSRTRALTDPLRHAHEQRAIMRALLERIPPGQRDELCRQIAAAAVDKRYNIVHLIYQDKAFDGSAKEYRFSRGSMRIHWRSGRTDLERTLSHPDWSVLPSTEQPVATHDLHWHDPVGVS